MSLTFADLSLHDALLAALNEAGYNEPTPIQAQAIPIALTGKDLMASAQTGTGKTAAFLLPALHRMTMTPGGKGKGPRILVLTPTRELARQVETAARVYGARLKIRTASILGGMNYQQQAKQLIRPVDVMVATPGRLLDLMNRGQISLERVEMLVLDEADRMLDLGFIDDVELIAEKAPKERQTLLFSATLEDRIATLAARVMNNPERLQISAQRDKHENITQGLYFCDDIVHKKAILLKLLADPEVNQSVVFTATRRDSEELSIELANFGIQTAALHGDMKQPARNRTLRALKDGQVKCLVATDVAARGIDVVGISHVFNFDLPMVLEDYVHRIGRTGRAGRTGNAISLVNRRDRGKLQRLAAYTGNSIPELTIPGMEPRPAPKYREGGPSRDGGRGGFGGQRREGGYQGNRDRSAGDRPSYGDRPAYGDRPRSPGFGENRPEGARREGGYQGNRDRSAGDRPSYGDRPAYGDRPSYGAPRGDRPSYDRPAYADRAAAPRGDHAPAPRSFEGNDESIGNRAGVATHERSAFDRTALRGDRGGYRGGAGRPDFRSAGAGERPAYGDRPARPAGDRPSYGDRPARPAGDRPSYGAPRGAREGFSADRPQPQVREYRARDNREGAASKEGFDGKRSDRTPGGPRNWSK